MKTAETVGEITTATEAAEAATANADFEPLRAGRLAPGRPAQLLAELFEAHASMVLGICRGMLRHAHDAEDAAQQTFLSAYASLTGGTVPREPAAWLATIARNECRTRVRKQMREPVSSGHEPYGESADPAEQVVRSQELESLRHALAGLPGQQRNAFLLREFSGFSYDELGDALGVSRPAVESLLFRARQHLRVSLRTAMAGVTAAPASLRDWVEQLFGSSPETPATVAKIGSLSIMAKIAAATAGTALLTAGAVVVAPQGHRAAPKAEAAPKTAAVARRVAPAHPAASRQARASTPSSLAKWVAVRPEPRRSPAAGPSSRSGPAGRPASREDGTHDSGTTSEPRTTTTESRTSGDGHSKQEGSSTQSGPAQTQTEPQHQDAGSNQSDSSDQLSSSGDQSLSSGDRVSTSGDSSSPGGTDGGSGDALAVADLSHDSGS